MLSCPAGQAHQPGTFGVGRGERAVSDRGINDKSTRGIKEEQVDEQCLHPGFPGLYTSCGKNDPGIIHGET